METRCHWFRKRARVTSTLHKSFFVVPSFSSYISFCVFMTTFLRLVFHRPPYNISWGRKGPKCSPSVGSLLSHLFHCVSLNSMVHPDIFFYESILGTHILSPCPRGLPATLFMGALSDFKCFSAVPVTSPVSSAHAPSQASREFPILALSHPAAYAF